ncbi:uncharacterized protein VP01_3230g9 [Puccinia sorghi]|uniref:Integrase catalytic domain-containing protein n=1 Tax=Puccinia sorghi TaxID=27349 RepID=A0A0L6V030_9BASI|nr:uncharacterized protein VP01_3230g9 [Puccinia sorghi]
MKLKNGTGSITLNNVYYSPNAACALLSAETLQLGGVPAIVTSTCPPVVFVTPVNHVSESKHVDPVNPQITVMNSILKESDALMWHRRLRHTSLKRIIKMCSSGELPGLPSKLTNKDFICKDCLVSKSKRQRGSRLSDKGELQLMDIIVLDLLGPFVEGFLGVQYVVVFRDLATTYSEGFLLKSKKDVCLTLKRYIEQMERLTRKKLKIFRTDGGGEFTSKAFLDWMKDKGITHQHLIPYEPEHNGASERLHWTVGEMARTALVASGLPVKFWGFAYLWVYFTHNLLINTLTGDKTPLELMFNKKPIYKRLHSFGEVSFVHKPNLYRKGKTDARTW